MFRIFTDNTDTTFSLDNFAFLTDRFYWWSDFHLKSSFPKRLYYVFPDAIIELKQTRPSAIVARTRQEINFFLYFFQKIILWNCLRKSLYDLAADDPDHNSRSDSRKP